MVSIYAAWRVLKKLPLPTVNFIQEKYLYHLIFFISLLYTSGAIIKAQAPDSTLTSDKLKKLSLGELMEIEVTSVSRRPEKLTEAASALQVITNDDIKRSGAANLPEALRLATNLQVAQLKSGAWIISARGFNAVFPNKLLVLIDGRTVYSPLFAGVFWDAQNVLLEDVERIEVISGPGGTLWGANAVNGVINIITKNAKHTKGLYANIAAGSFLRYGGALRYSGSIGNEFSYRIYAQHTSYNNTFLADKKANTDSSQITQTGFRIDWQPSTANSLAIIGNFYIGNEKTKPLHSGIDGQNILCKFSHSFSEKSEFIIQAYADRTWRRDIPSTISDQLHTYDFDLQHFFSISTRNIMMWGIGYRLMQNETQNNTPIIGFLPADKNMELFTAFLQDELLLIPEKLKLKLGAKLQHNSFSGFEIQPDVRLAWTPNNTSTLWAAASRAVRTPSRIDVDYYIPTYPLPPFIPHVAGGPQFTSEKVIAYEAGYRVRPLSKLDISLAMFYNQYNDLYGVEALPGTYIYQVQNTGKGYSRGTELAVNYFVLKNWRLRTGFTHFFKKLENKPGRNADYSTLGIDPENQLQLQSITNFLKNFQFDIVARYVSSLPITPYSAKIPAYLTADIRIAWQYQWLELSIVGKNILSDTHQEFGSTYIPRNYYGKITCRF